jgi:ribosomal protein S18 acetylase RimI-like enzyme
METIEYSDKPGEYDGVLDFFKVIDSYYYPQLSKRCSLREFIDPVIKEGNIIYIKEKGKIIAMITYFYFNEKFNSAYIDTISIIKDHRRKGLGKMLIDKCLKDLKSKDIGLVKLRTWSTNEITTRFYPKIGFKVSKVVKNDRGKGIDSIYYEKKL